MKSGRIKLRVFVWLVLIVALCVTGYSGYRYLNLQKVYAQGDASYEELRSTVKEATEKEASVQNYRPEIPDLSIDFAALKKINSDSIGWLYSPGTPIDYPVMRSDDYNRYLHRLPDGSYNANGSIFLDYNSASDFSGQINVLYGHHMRSGKMFGSLVGYKQQAYFDKHPYLYLYTEKGNYRIELTHGFVVDAGQWRERAFMFEANLEGLLKYASTNTTFASKVSYTKEDRFIALSTCSYEFDDARYVVIGVMRPVTETSKKHTAVNNLDDVTKTLITNK